MSVAKRQIEDLRDKKGKRGSVNNKSRLADFGGGNVKGDADWGACDPKWLYSVIVKITSLGGAVLFGLSRDEGAHALTLMLDDERTTMYFNGAAELDPELEAVCARLDGLAKKPN